MLSLGVGSQALQKLSPSLLPQLVQPQTQSILPDTKQVHPAYLTVSDLNLFSQSQGQFFPGPMNFTPHMNYQPYPSSDFYFMQ